MCDIKIACECDIWSIYHVLNSIITVIVVVNHGNILKTKWVMNTFHD